MQIGMNPQSRGFVRKVPATRAKLVFFLSFGPVAFLFAAFIIAVAFTDSGDKSTFLLIELPYVAIVAGLIVRTIYGLNLEINSKALVYRTMFRTIKFERAGFRSCDLLEGSSGLVTVMTPAITTSDGKTIRLRVFNLPKSSKEPSAEWERKLTQLQEMVQSLNDWGSSASSALP